MHPKVLDVAVFGLPTGDGQFVQAVVQPADGVDPSPETPTSCARSFVITWPAKRSRA
jgi:acyl-coenzyme A synthetase/AMP-(fatty) acid ligase